MLNIFADALLIATRMEPFRRDDTRRTEKETEARRRLEQSIPTRVRF